MTIGSIIDALEGFAPLPLQDDFDNSGLQIGLTETETTGALLCLDVTEEVVYEAIELGYNLIVSHHPLIFTPLKHITGASYIERCIILAIKHNIAIYSAHTNFDNLLFGVNREIADIIGLSPMGAILSKDGENGSGLIGNMPHPISEENLLELLQRRFSQPCIRHNGAINREIKRIAICGGSGAFLIPEAIALGADAFITGEIGYHKMFGYDGRIKIIELGHYESEHQSMAILHRYLLSQFPNLEFCFTSVNTNPYRYYITK